MDIQNSSPNDADLLETDLRSFLDEAKSFDAITDFISTLSTDNSKQATAKLTEFLLVKDRHTYGKESTPALACRALIGKGASGIEAMASALLISEGAIMPTTILESLWYASHGELAPISFFSSDKMSGLPVSLNPTPSDDAIQRANLAFRDFVSEAQDHEPYFDILVSFLSRGRFASVRGGLTNDQLRADVFAAITECSIRITKRILHDFEQLLSAEKSEEEYQVYLSDHPVFLDPLASKVIPKQAFGVEFKSDFVIQRLDNEYLVVEIEKPQDRIFTLADDFTSKFSHALGQVLDFLEWVDTNGAYANNLMPGISSPKGQLVMGLRSELTDRQTNKLKRLCLTLNKIEIRTFDDLLTQGRTLYSNLHRN